MSRALLGAVAVFALALAIYTLSLAPSVFSWDSAELTLGIYTQGIVHATGYPLYLLLGRAFTLLPLSADFAVRVNLFSAVCAALTVALLYAINLRLFQRPLIALTAALLYGLTREIWAQSVVAEVYTLHTALMAGILWGVVMSMPLISQYTEDAPPGAEATRLPIKDKRTKGAPNFLAPLAGLSFRQSDVLTSGGATGQPRFLWGIALLFGLALGNHMAALLVAAVVLPYLLWRTKNWRVRFIMFAIIAVTTTLLYLYLPIRFAAHPAFNLVGQYFERDLTQPGDLLWMVSGRMFGREMLAYPLFDWLGEIIQFGGELWLNYVGVGLLLGVIGIYHLWRTQRSLCLLLGAIFTVQVLFFSSYNVFDKNTMFHTAYLVWAIFIAAGCVRLLDALPQMAVIGFMALLVLAQALGNWNTVGRAGDTFVADRSAALLAILPPDAMLIGPWTAVRPLEYDQIVNGERRDVQIVDVTLLALGERDKLGGDSTDLAGAVEQRLQRLIICATGQIFVVDPAILAADLYAVEYVQSGLYRLTDFPPGTCHRVKIIPQRISFAGTRPFIASSLLEWHQPGDLPSSRNRLNYYKQQIA